MPTHNKRHPSFVELAERCVSLTEQEFAAVIEAWAARTTRSVCVGRWLMGSTLYLAVGPRGAVKVGSSQCPAYRVTCFNHRGHTRTRFESVLGAYDYIGLALVVRGASRAYEYALHRALRDEALGLEWFRGPATSLLLSLATAKQVEAA